MRSLLSQILTELIGTFFLTMVAALTGHPLAIGAVLAALVYAGGPISGGHYNPAVSIAALLRGKLTIASLPFFLIAQVLGAAAASVLYRFVASAPFIVGPGDGVSLVRVFVIEMMFTLALCLTVLRVATDESTTGNQYTGIAIGAMLFAGVLAGAEISGGVYNPAITLGAMIVDFMALPSKVIQLGVYIGAQVGGGVIAALLYRVMTPSKASP